MTSKRLYKAKKITQVRNKLFMHLLAEDKKIWCCGDFCHYNAKTEVLAIEGKYHTYLKRKYDL